MANLQFANPHNNAAELEEHTYNEQFHDILRFLRQSHIAFAITTNPNVYETPVRDFWRTAEQEDVNGVATITARVYGRQVRVTEATIRSQLHLNDEGGVTSYPNRTIMDNLDRMGYEREGELLSFQKGRFPTQWKYLIHVLQTCISKKRSSWNEFNLTLASALVALATGEVFDFSRMIFRDMLGNISSPPKNKFLMYPRFLQIILDHILGTACQRGKVLVLPPLSKHNFSNMGRTTSGYRGNAPLFSTMMVALAGERVESLSTAQPTSAEAELDIVAPTAVTPTFQPSPSSPTLRKSPRAKRFPSPLETQKKPTPKPTLNIKTSKSVSTKPDKPEPSSKLFKKVVKTKGSDHAGRALTTAVKPIGRAQASENVNKTPTAATPFGGPWCQETKGEMEASARQEIHSKRSNDSLPAGTQQGNDEDSFDKEMNHMSKELTDATPVPKRTKILKKKKHQTKSSNEPSTAGTQQLVGEDRSLLHKSNELTVISTVPQIPKKTSSLEGRPTMTRKELTVKVRKQEEQIGNLQGLISSLSKHIVRLKHSQQKGSGKFKGEKKAEYKLPTPSQSTEDEIKGELGRTTGDEIGEEESVEEGTGISMEERTVEVSEGEETAAQNSEVSLQRETTAIDTLVLAIAAPASTEGLMMLAEVSTSVATANLTTTGRDLTTTGSSVTTAAITTTAGSSMSGSDEIQEERTAGVGVLVGINFRERNFSETSAPGAGTSNPHFSQERYLAELLAKRKEEKLHEENLAREAEQVVARQELSRILNEGATLRIHVVPTKEPRKVYVAGKGKNKVREMTKLEQKAKFFADQAMARLNRFIENKENLKHLIHKRMLEEDLLVWDSLAQKQKDEELARKLQEEELVELEREKAESEKLEKERLKDEQFKAGVKKLESKRKLPLRYHPRKVNDKQIFMEYLKNTGKYSGKQLGPMGFEKMKELYDKERKARAEKDEVIDISKEEFERGLKKDSDSDLIDVQRYEAEQRAKAKWDRDERERLNRLEKERIKEQKRVESEEKKRKIESLISRTSSRVEERKKRKLVDETTAADSTGDSTTHPHQLSEVIKEEDVMYVEPLNTEVPIVNWFATERDKKQTYRIEKADGSFLYFNRVKRIFSELNINELAQMYQVGMRLQRTANRLDRNGTLFRHLQMMFEPDLFTSEIYIFEDVHSWEIYAKSGVYCIQFKSDIQYFLVEKEYKHNVNVMRMLLKKKLVQLQVTEYAELLIKKITKQIEDSKKRKRED